MNDRNEPIWTHAQAIADDAGTPIYDQLRWETITKPGQNPPAPQDLLAYIAAGALLIAVVILLGWLL